MPSGRYPSWLKGAYQRMIFEKPDDLNNWNEAQRWNVWNDWNLWNLPPVYCLMPVASCLFRSIPTNLLKVGIKRKLVRQVSREINSNPSPVEKIANITPDHLCL